MSPIQRSLARLNGLVIQCTSGQQSCRAMQELHAEGFVALWKGSGAVLELWSWNKAGQGGQRNTWQLL
jgi:hypothetical protein